MADRWWIGGTGAWTNTAFWSDSPGGSGGFSVPVAGDNVYINPMAFGYSGSFQISGASATCDDFVIANFMGPPNTITISLGDLTVRGSFSAYGADITWYPSTTLTAAAAPSQVGIYSDVTFQGPVTINAPSKTVQINSAITISVGGLTLTAGTLDNSVGSYTVTCNLFVSSNANTRQIKFDNGSTPATWIITGSSVSAWLTATSTNLTTTFISGSKIAMTSASAKTFASGGKSYPTLVQGGTGTLTISGGPTLYELNNLYSTRRRPTTITFTSSTTTTVTNFDLQGASGSLVTINSSTAGTQATLSKSSGTVSCDYLSIRDSNATGGATWYAGANSVNVSNNTGWNFSSPSAPDNTGNFLAFFG